jgi:dipeptidyl aminopeptidase/acylaminoacyl peptidase
VNGRRHGAAAVTRAALVVAVAASPLSCGRGVSPPAGPALDPQASASELPPVLATERGAGGGVLVLIDEHGDRQAELLTEPADTSAAPVRDSAAAYSPDGRWIVFASSRGQASVEHSALWLAPARAGATPIQLTAGPADLAPAWTADGQGLVFSRVEHGDADLWQQRLDLDPSPHLVGDPRPVALGVDHQLSPTVAGDGRIAYARLGLDEAGRPVSRIHLVDLTGHDVALTVGPADSGPRFSPDGATLVFSRPTVRAPADPTSAPGVDADLWVRAGDGTERRLWDLAGTDEGGPVFSVDGRWLFATSVAHGSDGSVVLASVVYADLWDQATTVRLLRDRAGVWTRMAPALAPVVLDSAALAAGPEYRAELGRAIVRAVRAAGARGRVP